jgi:hypothetical protein
VIVSIIVVAVLAAAAVNSKMNNHNGKFLHLCLGPLSHLILPGFYDRKMHVPCNYCIMLYNLSYREKSSDVEDS